MKSQAFRKTNAHLSFPRRRESRIFKAEQRWIPGQARNDNKKKVFVAMSGGVDSSVAAALLKQATPNNFKKLFGRPTPKGFRGYEVIGAHMRCFNVDGCAERDAEDARRVAEQLGIPFYVFDFEDEYKTRVVDYMIKGYGTGITPNPDVMCNKEIKFGLFFEKAMALGADYVATGHYVRLRPPLCHPEAAEGRRISKILRPAQNDNQAYSLCVAKDTNKDQSYFLWTLTQKQLRHCIFPIGEHTKPQVRAFAKKFGLLTASKKDSQGICFLGQVSIREFLAKYIKPRKGDVLTVDGRIVGTHDGAHLYTIGQRNLGIKNMELGTRGGHGAAPHYVIAKDLKKNTITIAPENHPALYQKEIKLTNVNFISPKLEIVSLREMSRRDRNWKLGIAVRARVRYRQPLFPATLVYSYTPYSRELENKKKQNKKNATHCKLVFDAPQKFVAIGQSAVFYLPRRSRRSKAKAGDKHGREMLGGGIIAAQQKACHSLIRSFARMSE